MRHGRAACGVAVVPSLVAKAAGAVRDGAVLTLTAT